METPSGIEVGVDGPRRIIRVTGGGTHLNSSLLKRYACRALQQKCALIFELGGCTYMDSTFLGMLAGLALRCREGGQSRIRVLAASLRVRELMENLGIVCFFDFGSGSETAGLGLHPLEDATPAPSEKTREVLEAHRTLAAVAPANEMKFRDVIALLEEELAAKSPDAP
ncbi:MAG: STAS domain-containing protein [Verrucomicrobiae bacterium]|nr:STAS domain-containing protein [Verrucomicrobiae bacterium]